MTLEDFIDEMSARINAQFARLPDDKREAFHALCKREATDFVETMLTKGPPELFLQCYKEGIARRKGQMDPVDVAILQYISTHPAFAHLREDFAP